MPFNPIKFRDPKTGRFVSSKKARRRKRILTEFYSVSTGKRVRQAFGAKKIQDFPPSPPPPPDQNFKIHVRYDLPAVAPAEQGITTISDVPERIMEPGGTRRLAETIRDQLELDGGPGQAAYVVLEDADLEMFRTIVPKEDVRDLIEDFEAFLDEFIDLPDFFFDAESDMELYFDTK